MTRKAALVATMVAASLSALVPACGEDAPSRDDQARAALLESTRRRLESGTFDRPYAVLADALPNVRHEWNGRTQPASDAVVVGEIVEIREGAGYVASDPVDPALEIARVDFDDHRSQWRTLELVVEVDEAVGRDVDETVSVTWTISGLALARDEHDVEHIEEERALVEEGLRDLGPIAVLLVADYVDDLGNRALLEDAALVAEVAVDGSLSFPFMASEEASRFRGSIRNVGELVSEARKPPRTRRS